MKEASAFLYIFASLRLVPLKINDNRYYVEFLVTGTKFAEQHE